MAGPNDNRSEGTPTHIHIGRKKTNWLAWLLLALGILALLLALVRCHKDEPAPAPPAAAPATVPAQTPAHVVGATPDAGESKALMGTAGLGTYLAGSEITPRTFVFEKLNFDTAKSNIRPTDAAEVDAVAATLAKYPTTHIRIAGYADARGNDATNIALGKARADSVKAALVAKGIDASRVDTVSGGSTDPVGTNATASGRFENRRTEVVVTSR
jgi:outer membrane protein OmpA-like peptidoglycan-associated protein